LKLSKTINRVVKIRKEHNKLIEGQMFSKFGDWLTDQQNREDDIGYLARVLAVQEIQPRSSRQRLDEHRYWVDAVTKIDEPGHIHAFNNAWQEYLQARKVDGGKTD
jgi:hypothetical protein